MSRPILLRLPPRFCRVERMGYIPRYRPVITRTFVPREWREPLDGRLECNIDDLFYYHLGLTAGWNEDEYDTNSKEDEEYHYGYIDGQTLRQERRLAELEIERQDKLAGYSVSFETLWEEEDDRD